MSWQFPHFRNQALGAVSRLLPGTLAALLTGALFKLGAWTPLEQVAYTRMVQLRGKLPWDERVVVIAIDDATVQHYGQFPLNRQVLTQLLHQLSPAEPALIGINLVLTDPTPQDAALGAAIAQQGRVVLAQSWSQSGDPLLPTPPLEQGALALGQVLNQPDTDGITRSIRPLVGNALTFSFAVYEAYALLHDAPPLPDLQQPFWVNWACPAAEIPHYSLVQVVRGQVPVTHFHNKIVLIGNQLSGFDAIISPYDQTAPTTGVYLHATVLNNLLQQHGLRRWGWSGAGVLLLLLVAGPLVGLGLSRRRDRTRWVVLASLAGGWGVAALFLFRANLWVPVALPLATLGLTAIATAITDRLRLTASLQQEIERLWQGYHQDLLAWSELEPVPARSLGSASRLVRPPTLTTPLAATDPSLAQLTVLAERFAQSHAAYAAIARHLAIGLLATDQTGIVWFCNPAATAQVGVTVGDRLEERLVPAWVERETWQAIQTHLQHETSITHQVKQGDRWLELHFEALTASTDSMAPPWPTTGLLVVLEDISKRKQIEQNLEETIAHERELNQLKTRFVSMISHELRTPLSIIQSTADLLENYHWSASERAEWFQQIRNAIQHMTQLIEDVLLLGKAEAIVLHHQVQALQLTKFLTDLIENWQQTIGQERHIHLICEGQPQIVYVDPKLLRHCCHNLLSNAIKYSAPGSEIQVVLRFQADQVVLSVKDQGIGIPPEDLERLFDAFFRAKNAECIQGTGLGLTIVKKCVELLHGEISVVSELNVGTTFSLTLPICPPNFEPSA